MLTLRQLTQFLHNIEFKGFIDELEHQLLFICHYYYYVERLCADLHLKTELPFLDSTFVKLNLEKLLLNFAMLHKSSLVDSHYFLF